MRKLISLFRREKPHKTVMGKIVMTLAAHGIDTVLDIGGNVGQTGKALREYGYRGRIISFEPLPEAHALLRRAARGDPGWTVAPRMAIGAAPGIATLRQSASTDMSSILPAHDALMAAIPGTAMEAKIEAPMRTLADVIVEHCAPEANIFVKIDTQGYERDVLEGLGPMWERVTGLQIEMSLLPLYNGETLFDGLIALLKARGFEPHLLFDTYFSRELVRQLQIDGVFYRADKIKVNGN
ncbi:MAG: FkbM family methyltransferase [Alphaproteobacteria bacterium]